VPVIAVLTKHDRLIENAEMTLVRQQSGLTADQLSELALKKADTDLQMLIDPLEKLVDKNVIPHIHVSSSSSLFPRSFLISILLLQVLKGTRRH
jgi:hypothetical protein